MRTGPSAPIAFVALIASTALAGCIRDPYSAPAGAPYPGAYNAAYPAAYPGSQPYPYPYPYPYAYGAPPYGSPIQRAPTSNASTAGAPAAVGYAYAHVGAPYCWGGNGPSCYDCSGLTHAAWLAGGRSIPRTSEAQLASLTPIPMDAIRPGDILWRPGHVGLYVGGGWAIAATHTGDVVRYQAASGFSRAVRP